VNSRSDESSQAQQKAKELLKGKKIIFFTHISKASVKLVPFINLNSFSITNFILTNLRIRE
jgi:hypothetical protein